MDLFSDPEMKFWALRLEAVARFCEGMNLPMDVVDPPSPDRSDLR